MSFTRPHRVLLAKPGLDGHDRGVYVVARVLRDAGWEVIYTGLRQTPAAIAKIAVEEDVDVIGLSILSGAHIHLCEELIERLAELGSDIPIVVGGVIPDDDIGVLASMGIEHVLLPETPTDEVVRAVRAAIGEKMSTA